MRSSSCSTKRGPSPEKNFRKVLKIWDAVITGNLDETQPTNSISWHLIFLFKWPAWQPCNYRFCRNVSTSLHLYSVTRIRSSLLSAMSTGVGEISSVLCAARMSQAVKPNASSCYRYYGGLLRIVIVVYMLERPEWPNVSCVRRLQEECWSVGGWLLYPSVHYIMCTFGMRLVVCWLSVSYSVGECFSLPRVNSTSWLAL